jgi:parallel beta-helix repeat protein
MLSNNSRYILNLTLMLFAVFKLSAQDYYVSELLGNDTNNGSENAPFATINKGIQAVEPGGTVYVMEGEYRDENAGTPVISFSEDTNGQTDTAGNLYVYSSCQNVNNPHVVTINKSGNETQGYITLKNYQNHRPKIIFDGQGGIKLGANANYVIVEGFEVEGPSQSITYNQAILNRRNRITLKESQTINNNNHSYFSGKGIWGGYDAHHHIIIRNNIVHDTPGSGIRFNDSDYVTVENNTVYNTTWWTSSASSAVVFAETIAVDDNDNTTDIKMIMRGNIVYNNWNRIPFYMASFPDNGQPPSGNYGNAGYSTILDGQGLYVTRSHSPSDTNPRPGYLGTFLFENNLCVNNGKNGINFDRSNYSSAIIRNNTIYFNGVHDIIQDQSVAEGNPRHGGQKVAGIISNYVKNITVVNNIVVTRYSDYSALKLNNVDDPFTVDDPNTVDVVENFNDGEKIALNNIFVTGTVAYPGNQTPANMIDVSPQFVNAPSISNDASTISGWAGYLEGTDFSLLENSPAIDAGNQNYAPAVDIDGNSRPVPDANVISSTSFELSTDGWSNFGATTQTSSSTTKTGSVSLKVTNRTANWHSAKLDLDGILTVGETYTFYVWVKLADGVSGTAQLTIKQTTAGTASYTNLSSAISASSSNWVRLTGNFTHTAADDTFVYVKGPAIDASHSGDFYIDDFSLVTENSQEVDFSNFGDTIDIGAYEFQKAALSVADIEVNNSAFLYPNPASASITISNLSEDSFINVFDLLGRQHHVSSTYNAQSRVSTLDISPLSKGVYFIRISAAQQTGHTLKFIKH